MTTSTAVWLIPILLSSLTLGFYDIFKKKAVDDNSVMPVLFLATLCGSVAFLLGMLATGQFLAAAGCSVWHWHLLLLKSLLVSGSWICVYYAVRELPISIASPIRASAPFWTFLGSLILYCEVPTFMQALGMVAIFAGYYAFSLIGKMEGISFRRHRGIHLAMLGTILGASSALYDKYLLGVLHIPRNTVQFWFAVDLVVILGLALMVRKCCFKEGRPFVWKWSILLTGLLLILSDYLYFYAVSLPGTHISILSLVRRSNCIVSFTLGCIYFRDSNVKNKAFALGLIVLGVLFLALS